MKKTALLILISASALLTGCTSEQKKMQTKIQTTEQNLMNDSSALPDKQKAAEMIHLYIAYADKFQDDSISAEYLFRAADLTNGLHQPQQAIELYQRVQRYATYAKTPIALFLQGFVAETELHDFQKAKDYYQKFLNQYPQHKLANDVQTSLDNLGKTPEELIREFEAKAKEDSLVAN